MAICRVKRALQCVSFLLLSWMVAVPVAAQPPQPAPFVPNQYILLLEDAPVSARFASREQMRTAAAVAYRQQVEAKQAAVLKELAVPQYPGFGFGFRAGECHFRGRSGEPGGGTARAFRE